MFLLITCSSFFSENFFRSGTANFCAVSLALNEVGYRTKGVRLDSGDLAYLSIKIRGIFKRIAEKYSQFFYDNNK